MTAKTYILLLESHLSAAGLSPEAFRELAAGWDPETEVRLVRNWTAENVGTFPAGARIILGGRAEPLPWFNGCGPIQFPVDISGTLPWLGGDPEVNAAALLKGALAAAKSSPIRERVTLETFPRVLVVGSGDAARRAARKSSTRGLETVWASPEPVEPLEGVLVLPGAQLSGSGGFAGRFRIAFETDDGPAEIQAGAVILAGLDKSRVAEPGNLPNASTLSAFEAELGQTPAPAWTGKGGYKVAFLAGLDRSTSTADMRRLLEAARTVAAGGKARAYLLAPQIKVAATGLERLYTQARESGVIFIRTPESGPTIEVLEDGSVSLKVFDPLARADLRLKPDRIVVEEPPHPAEELIRWAGILRMVLAPDGYLTPDNVLFPGPSTTRHGIFAVGPARGTDSNEAIEAEIDHALADAARIIDETEMESTHLAVDKGRCAICLTCVRVCPHNAMGYTHRPFSDPAACQRCGVCAAECPMDAIQLADYTDFQIKARLEALLERPKKDGLPRIVVFGCRRSAAKALAAAPKPRPADVVFLAMPCAGRIEDDLVFSAFLGGADGVLMAACHEDNCRTHYGSPKARRRFERIRDLLAETGYDPERLGFTTTAPNMGVLFGRTLADFSDSIGAKGSSPINGED
jgi:coenzyme F420-reducing hydrogenase delta subunit/Pyruvate/2-oxoacid:ferredoxin oxidoreductase delta subunit